jgi:hypothetical protein
MTVYQKVSVRFDPVLIDQLRMAARKRAFTRNLEVSWVDLLHEAGRELVAQENNSKARHLAVDTVPA